MGINKHLHVRYVKNKYDGCKINMNYSHDMILTYIDEMVKKLPVLFEIVSDKYVFVSRIYGGFLRFFLSHYFRHDKPPTFEEVLGYLEQSDIDIKIKTYQIYDYFQNVRDLVQSSGGTIVYLEDDYSKSDYSKSCVNMEDSFDSKTKVYRGMYGIYIPLVYNGKKYTIRLELFINDAHRYETDFSVNTFSVGYCSREKFDHPNYPKKTEIYMYDRPSQKNIDQLKSMKFSLCRLLDPNPKVWLTVKKMYRLKKMYKQNYTIEDDDIQAVKECLEICEKYLSDNPGVTIHMGGLEEPPTNNESTTAVIKYSRGKYLCFDLPKFQSEMKDIYHQLGFHVNEGKI